MVRAASDLKRLAVCAIDGDIGSVDRLFFDDERWTVRHIVVDTGKWLPGRRVLISPVSVERIDEERRCIVVQLTKEKVRDSPDIDSDMPVSRQQEIELHAYYGFGPYWGGAGLWGATYYPAGLAPTSGAGTLVSPGAYPSGEPETPPESHGDSHLRSTREVAGYRVQASDEQVGHIEDFLIDEQTWAITQLVVDTSRWPGGKNIVVPADSVQSVDWAQQTVTVRGTAEEVRRQPEFSG